MENHNKKYLEKTIKTQKLAQLGKKYLEYIPNLGLWDMEEHNWKNKREKQVNMKQKY